ncbi:unnamed protein product [Pylaiella littoralis]
MKRTDADVIDDAIDRLVRFMICRLILLLDIELSGKVCVCVRARARARKCFNTLALSNDLRAGRRFRQTAGAGRKRERNAHQQLDTSSLGRPFRQIEKFHGPGEKRPCPHDKIIFTHAFLAARTYPPAPKYRSSCRFLQVNLCMCVTCMHVIFSLSPHV